MKKTINMWLKLKMTTTKFSWNRQKWKLNKTQWKNKKLNWQIKMKTKVNSMKRKIHKRNENKKLKKKYHTIKKRIICGAIPLSWPFDLDTVSYDPSVVWDLTLPQWKPFDLDTMSYDSSVVRDLTHASSIPWLDSLSTAADIQVCRGYIGCIGDRRSHACARLR